ncbi:MAG: CBS domain-containing protein [Kiritimatiellaeota bacterium]|nr:CBS domain-containing protein [Kiritimatiellota bacterium]
MNANHGDPGVVQLLGQELRIRDAMNRRVVTISSRTPMSELRPTLRAHRIAGIPVMDDGKLVGVISVEDMVNWITDGAVACPVAERMTRSPRALYADETLVHAINEFRKFGFFHFPVLDRDSGEVVGVVTREDVIQCLLKRLEIDYHEEGIRHYRASHIFEDIVADKSALLFHYYIIGQDFEKAGSSSSGLKKTLQRLGIHPDIVRRVAIATYEAEMNTVIYARTGELIAKVDTNQIRVEIEDFGPGIPDIAAALKPGFSTAPDWVRNLGFGAGMGLGNIQNCADEMNITSTVGKGIHLEITIAINKERVKYETKKDR